ncbi:MAG: GIY-YIG nuclease family protein [Bacteroidetes bacterium]|nr:GIY-YIG nuclease family protein [Bacteroidota bacterium]
MDKKSTPPSKEIKAILDKIKNCKEIPVSQKSNAWLDCIPKDPGNYIFYKREDKLIPIYVGETSNLHKRMKTFHTITTHPTKSKNGYKKIQELLKKKINIYLKFSIVRFGRKEFEEWFITRQNHNDNLLNYSRK